MSLATLNQTELRKLGKLAAIPKYSQMTKSSLIKAIEKIQTEVLEDMDDTFYNTEFDCFEYVYRSNKIKTMKHDDLVDLVRWLIVNGLSGSI